MQVDYKSAMLCFFSIYNFWGAVFILPESFLKQVDRKCSEYLPGTTIERKKVSLVAWDRVCEKKDGGLNIRSCRLWNIASAGKLLCQLIVKKDSLWVTWVHELYMKEHEEVWGYKAPPNSSWYRRKLHSLKVGMQGWMVCKWQVHITYSLQKEITQLTS